MKSKQKIIGIPGYKSINGDFFGAGINHLAYIERFGKARILMPFEQKVDIDLLYLPGGLDLSPSSYGEVPNFRTSNQDVMKEFFYHCRLKNYVGEVPIFGVCLGMQMLGVYFGSKLTQDLLYHEQSPDRWETAHTVYSINPPHNKKGGVEFEVNSHHHQCILNSNLSDELSPLFKADCHEPDAEIDEYIIEAFEHKTLPIVGVQWHPEELNDEFCGYTIKGLLNK